MLTKNGKILVGREIKAFLESLLPVQFTNCDLNSCKSFGGSLASLDGSDDVGGGIFLLEHYGQSLQPAMTPELQNKISKPVSGGNTY
jgi:hypothetical protein